MRKEDKNKRELLKRLDFIVNFLQRCKQCSNMYLTLSETSPGFYVSAVQVFRKH